MRTCSLCGQTEEEVDFMLAAPNEIFICDSCIELCNDLLEEHREQNADENDE